MLQQQQQQRPSPVIGNSTMRRSVLTATISRQHPHQHPDIDKMMQHDT